MSVAAAIHPGPASGAEPTVAPVPAPRRRGALFAALLALLVAAAAWPLFDDLAGRPLRSVLVAGEFHHLSRAALEAAVIEEVGESGFIAVDVDAVRQAAMSLPWVREATVRRVWPDRLQIAVVERGAVAVWNDTALLEEDAARFVPRSVEGLDALPALSGPDGQHAGVLDRLREFEQVLAGSALGLIAALALDERGAWRLRLADGAQVVLGHGQGAATLRRFARTVGNLLEVNPQGFERADLRYSNGFAVRWRAAPEAGPAGDSPGQDG